jgi:hypothetical protein
MNICEFPADTMFDTVSEKFPERPPEPHAGEQRVTVELPGAGGAMAVVSAQPPEVVVAVGVVMLIPEAASAENVAGAPITGRPAESTTCPVRTVGALGARVWLGFTRDRLRGGIAVLD